MQTALIAHPDNRFASEMAATLLSAGYRSVICAGAQPPARSCARYEQGFCQLTAEAQVMIYDPDLVGLDREGRLHRLAVDSACSHPGVPMLLAWPGDEMPASVTPVLEQAPDTHLAAREPEELVEQVRRLIGPP